MIYNRLPYSIQDSIITSIYTNVMKFGIASLITCIYIFCIPTAVHAQIDSLPVVSYDSPQTYEIGVITVKGAKFSDENAIINISGLKVGKKINIPGEDIPKAIKALWRLKLFTDIQIVQEKTIGEVIFLEIHVSERPRLSGHSYKGAKKSYHDDLNDAVNRYLTKGGIVTENIKANAKNAILDFYKEKGYLDTEVTVKETKDKKKQNSINLDFVIDKKERVKIKSITFSGNENVKARKLRKQMEDTKRKSKLFTSSKLIKPLYEADKKLVIDYYNTLGFRDAKIISDSIWRAEGGDLKIHINIHEGKRYYFRNITWNGNSIYDDATLDRYLGISKGDPFNQELLQTRLQFSMDGRDVSSLYLDNGYLFFRVDPIEVAIDNDSIDLEMRIYEGPLATIDRVVIKGNDRTHEHVIRRELRTKPGQKFSRSDIIRSQRQIVTLGYFNPEALEINTPVNPQRGTVDIEYTVEEKPSDQLELSAGWGGASNGVIGTLGVSFNNFSLRNIFNKSSWSPLPQGDGQRLSVRAQTNGRFYQSYNFSFTEPWLGGNKPNSFTLGGYYTKVTNGADKGSESYSSLGITNFSVGIGTRLRWPDDNFIFNSTINVQNILLNKWTGFYAANEAVNNGDYNNLSLKLTLARTTVNDLIFPTSGSRFSLTTQLTPPYSLFNNTDYTSSTTQEKFKWLEYRKWRFDAEWYVTLVDKLVLATNAKIGMLGYYNSDIGLSPFERFQLGGDGLSNQQFGLTGFDIISLRGYELSDVHASENGAAVFDKFTVELRYPISTNPNSTIYIHTFMQGGNAWSSFREFNPFDIKRSVGAGLRVFLPMFGILGFDYGLGFDKPVLIQNNSRWTDFARFSIILGFEPD